ncbi:hypothetical protein RFI_27993 [Reticulomyxa filosa]|uniref:Uncharacterized protein n=1 Tax=Reticulomyxa filosa TaxID=46433 RepID=X6M5Y7_RETFI|nr:hypothetical protein RFI_27993 [Reticulomyxa filosa]|eukprot:ETO09383.1 hypothetical protein RFI_27993 [Reticulomyxa filosa]
MENKPIEIVSNTKEASRRMSLCELSSALNQIRKHPEEVSPQLLSYFPPAPFTDPNHTSLEVATTTQEEQQQQQQQKQQAHAPLNGMDPSVPPTKRISISISLNSQPFTRRLSALFAKSSSTDDDMVTLMTNHIQNYTKARELAVQPVIPEEQSPHSIQNEMHEQKDDDLPEDATRTTETTLKELPISCLFIFFYYYFLDGHTKGSKNWYILLIINSKLFCNVYTTKIKKKNKKKEKKSDVLLADTPIQIELTDAVILAPDPKMEPVVVETEMIELDNQDKQP